MKKLIIILLTSISCWSQSKIKIHNTIGVQSQNFTIRNPTIYSTLYVDINRFIFGVQYYVQVKSIRGYGILIEYKLF